ncbi:MAG TPA: aldolase [Gammaproteobacteria bacterium]|nr:aldolase [Gammaproteobacteria bacterium]
MRLVPWHILCMIETHEVIEKLCKNMCNMLILSGKTALYGLFSDFMSETEGVIKFQLDFEQGRALDFPQIESIELWRQRLMRLGLIGQDDARYEGLGFGNISHRVNYPGTSQAFVITGTQTGRLQQMGAEHYALVTDCDPRRNWLQAQGEVKPSSEAMTHAVIYQKIPQAEAVVHIHSPELWRNAQQLGLAITNPAVEYGTPQMATEIERIIDAGLPRGHTISMGGHEDGVITWGESLHAAGNEILMLLGELQNRRAHSQ